MSEKPNVTVIYQDARTPTNMGCVEAIVSVAALIGWLWR